MTKKRANSAGKAGATGAEAGRAFGVTAATIRSWVRDGFPRLPDGSYDLPICHRWLVERAVERERLRHTKTNGTANDGDNWDLRDRKATALTKEQKLAVLAADYLHREDVERLWTERVQLVTAGLDALEHVVAPKVAVDEEHETKVRTVIAEQTRKLRQAYADGDVLGILTEWRRLRSAGSKPGATRGRGRPRKPKP